MTECTPDFTTILYAHGQFTAAKKGQTCVQPKIFVGGPPSIETQPWLLVIVFLVDGKTL